MHAAVSDAENRVGLRVDAVKAEVASLKASLSGVESHLDAVKNELAANEAAERERLAAHERAQLAQRKQVADPVSRIATALAKQLATPIKLATNALR